MKREDNYIGNLNYNGKSREHENRFVSEISKNFKVKNVKNDEKISSGLKNKASAR